MGLSVRIGIPYLAGPCNEKLVIVFSSAEVALSFLIYFANEYCDKIYL